MSKNQDVNTMLETVEKVLDATHVQVDSMNEGDRITVSELTKRVSQILSMEPKKVVPYITLFVQNTTIAHVSRGAKGGLVRNKK